MVSNLPTIITRTALYSSCSLELTITVRNIQLHDWQPRKGTAALRTRESLGRRRKYGLCTGYPQHTRIRQITSLP
jgi:hypothetical protein